MLKHNFVDTFNKYEIHFAAQTHVDNSYINFAKFIDDNIIYSNPYMNIKK